MAKEKYSIIHQMDDGSFIIDWYFAPQIGKSSEVIVSIPISKEDLETLEENGFIHRHEGYFDFDKEIQ